MRPQEGGGRRCIDSQLRRVAAQGFVDGVLANAAKYGTAGGRVRLEVAEQDGAVLFRVQDFGQGIPKTEHENVFKPFCRVGDELTRSHPGSGLGLALVAEYVKAHAGSVSLASEPGAGAVFTIRLPRSRRVA